ncbi:MAG: hypothetical protein HQL91_04380 [Magnetococcales bacterium]|nr:hypothetical protein [Magnetococcales bacterium]
MSTALAFDTYAYVRKLRDAGVDEDQAAIQAEALVVLVEDRWFWWRIVLPPNRIWPHLIGIWPP